MRQFVLSFLLVVVSMVAIDRAMSSRSLVATAGAAAGAGSAPTTAAADAPWPVKYQHIVRENPPEHLHLITVDLRDPRVHIRVCAGGDDPDGEGPWQTTIRTVREIAENNNLAAAVNANFFTCKDELSIAGRQIPYFAGNWAMGTGWVVIDGKVRGSMNAGVQSVMVDRAGRLSFGKFYPKLPAGAWQGVAGSELTVREGKITATAKDRAPRTVVGCDRANTKLIMLVVDGRRDDYSVGMTGAEAAREMIDAGAYTAINLDGGGSSTIVMRDPSDGVVRLLNRPSDGHDLPISLSVERPVAYAFGVQVIEEKDSR